ncbi:RNase LS, toxin [Reichenbachiella agariperforans]|uniref:RNase LS, toxin n=1 Tax=Reichenbachiella agariperforans TaxID=156994 RepID=A0A1M6J2Y1_REIAG|nr:type II toxin-antitoxin system RnlA family toxin [Reichenbachiella agariperforans]SHJ41080.1 RNase LS, toxin [Reichenbachiella agariperforans]
MSTTLSKPVEDFIDKYCEEKGYKTNKKEIAHGIHFIVTNLTEKITLDLYHKKGSLVVGGSPKLKLRQEFNELKNRISEDPQVLENIEKLKIKSCAQKYVILGGDLQNSVKQRLGEIDGVVTTITESPTSSQQYRGKLIMGSQSLTITQFTNDTLFLQGKDDSLFNDVCDEIEKLANPTANEVAARFVSDSEQNIKALSDTLTLDILTKATENIKESITSECFDFLESHDQKWLVAAECLRLANIPLPEFSPIVMPASKAFEGFAKKTLVKIGLFPANHFDIKTATFGFLNDKNHPNRKSIEAKERVADSYLKKFSLSLDMTRNFMMHSDDSTATKINSFEEASKKLDEILANIKELFEYFGKSEFGGLTP